MFSFDWLNTILLKDGPFSSQLLSSCRLDMEYLGMIMEFALVSLQKLSAVAHENRLKESHQKVISELVELCQAGDGSNRSHAIALIKGLRFLLEQIQVPFSSCSFTTLLYFCITLEVAKGSIWVIIYFLTAQMIYAKILN